MDYRVLVGIDYNGKRAEPGSVVNDLPQKSVSWLIEQGAIERVMSKSREVGNANV